MTTLRLEDDVMHVSMLARLLRAAEYLEHGYTRVSSKLRPEQRRVVDRFDELLLDRVTQPDPSDTSPFWRIVLPPRTGKTVVAAHIVARTGLTAVFVVPTRTLVSQVVAEMHRHVPDVAVGVLHGGDEQIVDGGVNVVTYQILQSRIRRNMEIPGPIRRAGVIFVDEAHHAMTVARMRLLSGMFDADALRIGLTATPDYSRTRRLCHHFPTTIAEMGVAAAMRRNLLAPARAWIAEVDVDASTVRLHGGDYDASALGELMSAAPFFRAAELFRYDRRNAGMRALLCCVSRQQAYDLQQYLDRHRPRGTPRPQLILGDTPHDDRAEILERYEHGDVDTLIQVGVLIEGWNSPRCKLLIDLAPSYSIVRATQKYFRAMTRNGDQEARLYVLLPRDLPALPVLPPDLLGAPLEGYETGTLLGKQSTASIERPLSTGDATKIAGVRLRRRVLLSCSLEPPTLCGDDLETTREVLNSCPEFTPSSGRTEFRGLLFRHTAFSGSGALLLRHLRVQTYNAWMARLYPAAVTARMLGEASPDDVAVDEPHRIERILRDHGLDPAVWRAAGGYVDLYEASPEEVIIAREEAELVRRLLQELRPREQTILEQRFGLAGFEPMTFTEIGAYWERSTERMSQITRKCLRQLRIWWRHDYYADAGARLGARSLPRSKGVKVASARVKRRGELCRCDP